MTYTMQIAGLERQLPLCKVTDDLYIGAFGADCGLRGGTAEADSRRQL